MNSSFLFEVVICATRTTKAEYRTRERAGEENCCFTWGDHGRLPEEVKIWVETWISWGRKIWLCGGRTFLTAEVATTEPWSTRVVASLEQERGARVSRAWRTRKMVTLESEREPSPYEALQDLCLLWVTWELLEEVLNGGNVPYNML